jgi:hypothetical protein
MALTKVTGGGITADTIDSGHFVDGGIDNDHLATWYISI